MIQAKWNVKWGIKLGVLLLCFDTIHLAESAPARSHFATVQGEKILKGQGARPIRLSLAAATIAQQAKQVTVRVADGISSGSGVIIQRQSDTYTLLTAAHVVPTSEVPYQITTADQKQHPVSQVRRLSDIDLSVVTFKLDYCPRSQIRTGLLASGNLSLHQPGCRRSALRCESGHRAEP
jgi:hypothetical protein